jgi:hypothetical protein
MKLNWKVIPYDFPKKVIYFLKKWFFNQLYETFFLVLNPA